MLAARSYRISTNFYCTIIIWRCCQKEIGHRCNRLRDSRDFIDQRPGHLDGVAVHSPCFVIRAVDEVVGGSQTSASLRLHLVSMVVRFLDVAAPAKQTIIFFRSKEIAFFIPPDSGQSK